LSPLASTISRRSRPFKRDSPASGPTPTGVSAACLRSVAAPRGRFIAGGFAGGASATGFGVERRAAGSIELRRPRRTPVVLDCASIVGKVVSPITDGVLGMLAHGQSLLTHSNVTCGPSMGIRDGAVGAAPALGSGVKNPGAADASGLICRRLRKLGTSDAELRGIGPGDKVACREGRAELARDTLGGSGNVASREGGAPVIVRFCYSMLFISLPMSQRPTYASHSHGSSLSARV